MHMTTGEDSRDLSELFSEIRFLAHVNPSTLATLRASVAEIRDNLPTVALTATQAEIARQMGRDPKEVALGLAAKASAGADQALVDRLPKERVVLLRQFASGDVAAMASRARHLGWDTDKPVYPSRCVPEPLPTRNR